jgi:hypothetical protein
MLHQQLLQEEEEEEEYEKKTEKMSARCVARCPVMQRASRTFFRTSKYCGRPLDTKMKKVAA